MRRSTTQRIIVALMAAFITIALVVSMIATAGAHAESGEISAAVSADGEDPADITIRARIVYTDDGHPVEDDAVVTYQVTGPEPDVVVASDTMPRVGDGQYEVEVTLPAPDTYVVSITSQNPEADHTETHTVEAEPTAPAPAGDETDTDDDDVTLSWPIVIAIVVFLALVAGAVFLAARRRRR